MNDLFTKTKICGTCNFPKLLKEFDTALQHGKYVFRSDCIKCRSEKVNKDRKTKYRRHVQEYQKQYDNKRHYSLSQSDFERMIIEQNNECAICKTRLNPPYIDHNHETGEIRKLLCINCNYLIGHAKENPEILRAAAKYLEELQ